MEIIEFYKSGAQVMVRAEASDMTHSFTASNDGGEDVQIGYVPAGKAKPVTGSAHDVIEHGGTRHLLLKGGYVYDVQIGDGDLHVISAEAGHLSLPLPAGAEIDVDVHDPSSDPVPEVEDESGEGMLGDEITDEAVDEQPESTEDEA